MQFSFLKSKSQNEKIKIIYSYIQTNNNRDGDFWDMGGGYDYIQEELNELNRSDWEELKYDILNWSEFDQYILISAIPHGFADSFSPSLTSKSIINAGIFLLQLFRLSEDYETKELIADYSFFFNRCNINEIKGLEKLKDWMIDNEFNRTNEFDNPYNPIKNIEEAIKKAYS